MEKVELESALKAASNSSAHKVPHDTLENLNKQSNSLKEVILLHTFGNVGQEMSHF